MSEPWEYGDLSGLGDLGDLRQRLAELVEDPPPERILPAAIADRAVRSRRRRQTLGTLAVAALVAVVAAAGFVVVPLLRGGERVVPASGDARIVRLSTAMAVQNRAVQWGDDFATGPSPAPAGSVTAWGVGGGGSAQVLYSSGAGDPAVLHVGLTSANGTQGWSIGPPDGLAAFPASWAARAFDGRHVVQISTGRHSERSPWRVFVYDLVARTWDRFDVDPGRLRPEVATGSVVTATRIASGRTWFTVGEEGAPGGTLFSMPIGGGTVRYEGVRVGVWDAQSGSLAWSSIGNQGSRPVTVRGVGSGRESSIEVSDGADCRRTGLALGHSRIAVTESCDGSDPSRVHLLDLKGRQLVSLRGSDLTNAAPGLRTLIVSSPSPTNPGSFVYDVLSRTTTRLTGAPVTTRLLLGETGTKVFVPDVYPRSASARGPGVTWTDWPGRRLEWSARPQPHPVRELRSRYDGVPVVLGQHEAVLLPAG